MNKTPYRQFSTERVLKVIEIQDDFRFWWELKFCFKEYNVPETDSSGGFLTEDDYFFGWAPEHSKK